MSSINWDNYQIALSAQPLQTAKAVPQPLSRPLADRGQRLLAFIVDRFFCLSPAVVGLILAQGSGEESLTTMTSLKTRIMIATGAIILTQIILLACRGQSFGKVIFGLRIVNNDDEGNPGFLKAVVLRHIVPGLLGVIPFFGVFFQIVDKLFILSDDRRCIHDLIADTKVVEL